MYETVSDRDYIKEYWTKHTSPKFMLQAPRGSLARQQEQLYGAGHNPAADLDGGHAMNPTTHRCFLG